MADHIAMAIKKANNALNAIRLLKKYSEQDFMLY